MTVPREFSEDRSQARAGGEVYVSAAAMYVALLKNHHYDEATEFAEWFLETFDLDLET